VELLPVRPQAVALHPGVRNGRSEVLAGLGLHVAGDADPALVIDPLRMPQLMGPEAIGGDASKHPLVKRLQAVEPVLEFLVGGNDAARIEEALRIFSAAPLGRMSRSRCSTEVRSISPLR
jgi:hypothetical protein